LYNSERIVATRLRKLVKAHHKTIIHDLTQDELDEMDPDQRRALDLALSSKISIITGGPGVGKTHMIKQIIRALGPDDKKIYLAAPTGKAAKRMNEATGMEATTIHRLLEYSMQLNGFTRNSHHPLDCDALIIDETSMIDIRLMASLMDAFNSYMQVIFVGDVNQLPSVGPGRVLADMIDSEVIPVAWLNTLHRQAGESAINLNAKRINAGKKLDLSRADSDFWVCIEENVERIPDLITKTCKAIPRKYPEFTLNDIQVLCPQKRSAIGTKNLNEALRPILNPEGVKLKGVEFYSGDRVIQTKNNYNLEIFNGEIGRVSHVENDFLHLHRDDGRLLMYPLNQVTELKPAYALTIHKSQGSEFPCVIIPVHTSNYIMLQRNLLYTGITRGKKLVVLIGTMKAINLAIKTIDSKTRYTNLKRFIQNGVSE
jgi:exodeoxyribonuclease V alpha subunit